MIVTEPLNNEITILVNSCDAYSDLWPIFFSLLKKYWDTSGTRILLNTESRTYTYEGLDIECVHLDTSAYGARFIHALKAVHTKYVLLLLDDFFLRQPVDNVRINQLVEWMEAELNIICFNSEMIITETDLPSEYPGYKLVPIGTNYRLNLQAALWRVDKLMFYWKPKVSPWEWEKFCDIKSCWHTRDLVYCRRDDPMLFSYGNSHYGQIFALHRGKWVMEDVVPLFELEKIDVDLSIRGGYCMEKNVSLQIEDTQKKGLIIRFWENLQTVNRQLGFEGVLHFLLYEIHRTSQKLSGRKKHEDFYTYSRVRAKKHQKW